MNSLSVGTCAPRDCFLDSARAEAEARRQLPIRQYPGMRSLAYSFATFVVSTVVAVSALAADFARNFGGLTGGLASIAGTAVDAGGNEYACGYFYGSTFKLGNTTLSSLGAQDAFVAKIDANGAVVWAKGFGGTGAISSATACAIDGDGNLVVTGAFNTANLTTPALTLIGDSDVFVVKLDTNGTLGWAENFGGPGTSAGSGAVAFDVVGNIYVSGSFSGNLTTPPIGAIGNVDAFALKLDPAGAISWIKGFGGVGASMGDCVVAAGGGAVYLTGTLWNANLTTPPLAIVGTQDAIALKLDESGSVIWARNFGGSGAAAFGRAVAVDSAGNVYVGGHFRNDLSIPSLTAIGNQDSFVIKLSSGGSISWARNFGGPAALFTGNALAVDSTDNIAIAGNFNGWGSDPPLGQIGIYDAYAISLDATGTLNWAKGFGGSSALTDFAAVSADATGNVHLGGHFGGRALAIPSLTSIGATDAVMVTLDQAGSIVRSRNYGVVTPGGGSYVSAVVADDFGNEYIAGTFFGGKTLDIGPFTLNAIGFHDAFVARLDADGAVVWAQNFGGPDALTDATALAMDAAGNVYVAGTYSNGIMTTPFLPLTGIADAFALKLDAAGTPTWSTHIGGPGAQASVQSIAVDVPGNVYLGGYLADASLTVPALSMIGIRDALLIKLDSNGANTWARNFGGANNLTTAQAIAVDGAGNVHLVGHFTANGTLPTPMLTDPPLVHIGFRDALAMKIDATGHTVWARNYGGPAAWTEGHAVVIDSLGNAIAAGEFSSGNLTTPSLPKSGSVDGFVMGLDAVGSPVWSRDIGGPNATALVASMARDNAGSIYIGGAFNGSLTSPALSAIGSADAYVIKFLAGGSVLWASSFGGSGASAGGRSVAVDGAHEVFLGGEMSGGDLTTPPMTFLGGQNALVLGRTFAGVHYDGNGNTGGNPPSDIRPYAPGDLVTVAGPATISRPGGTFTGWNSAQNGTGAHFNPGDTFLLSTNDVTLFAEWVIVPLPPILQTAASRKVHGTAGAFDLPLSMASVHNPTTETRKGPMQTIVMTFDKSIASAIATVIEGVGTPGAPSFNGNEVVVTLSGVADQQYVTLSLSSVLATDGGIGAGGSVRVGFLMGDVTHNRVVQLSDLGLVNIQLTQPTSIANYYLDIDASGSITLADKALTNANLTRSLPTP